ncbi:MAG: hypothetical protein HY666_04755 [Chloroflexi bacterium]|nr:hypothetical protein [Chloroflexota bacterium]
MSPQVTNALKKSLASSLLQALKAIVEVAGKHGINITLPTATYDVVCFKDDKEQRITRSKPSFHGLPELLKQLGAHDPARISLQNLAREAASILERGSWPSAGSPQRSPERLAQLLIFIFLKEHLAFSPDAATIDRICSAFVDDVLSNTIQVTSKYLIESFSAPAEFQLDDHDLFRPIAADDLEQFGAVDHGQMPGFDRPWLSTSHWICEASDDGPKDNSAEALNRRFDHIDQILGALNLTAPGRVSCQLLSTSLASPFFGFGHIWSRNTLYSSRSGGKVVLDDAGVESFKKNYQLVKMVFGEARLERLRLPFRRLRAASFRREDEDKLVDYVIGLERLLASDSPNLEVTFRFRLRGAAILPPYFGDAACRKSFMSKLYGLRSTVVHGGAKATEVSEVSEMLPKAEAALRAVFLWFGSALDSGKLTDIVEKLDRELIDGASAWVESFRK